MTDWIEDWFGSEYYSLLYGHRNEDEARLFLDNLLGLLKITPASSPQSHILDCGCGKGRHAAHLCEKGYFVTGIDICDQNIHHAKARIKKNAAFYIHDMRTPLMENHYDMALNLFTSFGYFDKDDENNKIISSTAKALKPGGWFVLDFMNVKKEIAELVPRESTEVHGVHVKIQREHKNNCIIKTILVNDKGKEFRYREQVKAYTQNDLVNFFTKNKLEVVYLQGDYRLNPFNETTSPRLIIIGKKTLP